MNATNTHTPGPWHVGHDSTGTLLIVAGDGETFDGGPWVYDSDKPETRPISEADARLIAAAPAMLAALEDALETCEQAAQRFVTIVASRGGIMGDENRVMVNLANSIDTISAALRLARGS